MRFRARQRFRLEALGRSAEASYRSQIVASRTLPGRESYDAARAAWAAALSLQPDDGMYLGELRPGPTTLAAIIEALAQCGKSRADAVTAMGRLVDAGFVSGIDQ